MFIADRSDAFSQWHGDNRPRSEEAGNLHRRTQEDGVKHLFPRVLGKLPSLGQSAHQSREAKHLVEISLELVSGQSWRSSFSLSNRFKLTSQMVAAAASKSAHLDLLAHLLNQFRRNVERFGLAVNQHGDLILGVQAFAVGAMTVV